MQRTFHCISPFSQSSRSGFLISCRKIQPPHWFCSFISFSARSLSPQEIDEESTWQSSLKPHHHCQNSMTWTGRPRRHGALGWSGSWWLPPSPGGSSGAPERSTRSWLGRRGGGGGGLGWVQGHCEEVMRAGSERPAGAGDSAGFSPSTIEAGNRSDSPPRPSWTPKHSYHTLSPSLDRREGGEEGGTFYFLLHHTMV